MEALLVALYMLCGIITVSGIHGRSSLLLWLVLVCPLTCGGVPFTLSVYHM